jgi:hypothetical protein
MSEFGSLPKIVHVVDKVSYFLQINPTFVKIYENLFVLLSESGKLLTLQLLL